MNEPAPIAGPSNLSTPGDEHSPNTLFIGPHGLRPFWGLLLYFAMLLTSVMLLRLGAHLVHPGPHHTHTSSSEMSPFPSLIAEWLPFGFVFFATWIMGRIEGRSVFDYGLARVPRRWRWLAVGAALGLLFQSLLILILWSTHHLVFAGLLLRPGNALAAGFIWAVVFVGVSFFEEFLFRGYLQFNLTRCFAGLVRLIAPDSQHAGTIGFWLAAVIISFGFGFGHGTNPGESPIGLLCAGCAGLVFAFSLWRTGSLWWAIGLHAAWDWAQSFLFGVADSGTVSAYRLLSTHPVGRTWVSGGATGPEGSIFVLPVLVLITLAAVLTLPRADRSLPIDPPLPEAQLIPEVNSAQG